MDLSRFFIISLAVEVVFMPLLSFLILKRPFFSHYILCIIFSILGIVMSEITVLNNPE